MTIPEYLWYAPAVHPLARRTTDRERDQALSMLTEALQRGQLTVDEHAGRAEAALRARTVGDLVSLTRDLVPAPPPPPPPGVPPRIASGSTVADAALITGIVGLVLFPLFVGGVVAVVLGLVGLGEVRAGALVPAARPRALGGLLTGVLAILAGVLFFTLA
jgi:hypothetical protein